jgi:PBSX family phage portal protein
MASSPEGTKVTPIKPQVVSTSYDEVAATPVPGRVLSEVVEPVERAGEPPAQRLARSVEGRSETTDTVLRVSVLGDGARRKARDEGELVAEAESQAREANRSRGPHTRPQVSQQIADTWNTLMGAGHIRYPVYDPQLLAAWPLQSTILPQCLRALTVNVHGFGFDFSPLFDADELEGDDAFKLETERWHNAAKEFFAFASLDYSFTELVQRTALDRFTVGYSGWELLRDRNTAALVGLEHVPAITLRMGFRDAAPTYVTRKILSLDGSRWVETSAWKRLTRYAQIEGNKMVWFKEVGDPRFIDRWTGEVLAPRQDTMFLGHPRAARELLWFGGYNPADPYGYPLPCWIGSLIAAAGDRAADEINYAYFLNKSVPPLAVLVSGGVLDEASMDRIDEKMLELKGIENWHKMLVLHATSKAEGDVRDLLDPGAATTPKIELQPLTQAMHKDALFQKYKEKARDNVRSACGIPPIFIGETLEYNRATAEVAMEVAERGVFAPLRNEFDDRINRFIMPELGVLWWRFASGTPDLTNVEDVTRAIETGVKAGVGNPNVYAQVLEKVLKVPIPPVAQPWANYPIDLVKIALQSGLVTMDFSGDGEVTIEVNESMRDRFKETCGAVIEDALDRLLVRARDMAAA